MALASAALAFFSRALQASKSRRRFCRRRLSFCGVGEQGRVRPWEALGDPGLWQDWPTGPSGADRETEAQTGRSAALRRSAHRSRVWGGLGELGAQHGRRACAQQL